MKKGLIYFVLVLAMAWSVPVAGQKKISELTSISSITPGTLFEASYNTGPLFYSRKMSMNQLACFLADSGLTYTPTTGTALRLSIGGVKRWHLNDNIVDGATIDFDGSHALYVMADSGLAESFSGNGLKVVTDQTTIDLGAADPMGVPALRVKQYSIGWAQLNPGVWYKGLQANPSGGMGIMYRPMAHVDSVTIGFTGTNALYVVVEPDSGLDYDALTGKLRAEFDNVTITSDSYGLKVKNFSIDEYKIDDTIWYKGLMKATGGMGIANRPMAHVDSVTMTFGTRDALAVDTSKIVTQYDLASATVTQKDLVVSGTGMSGGADNVLPGADSDVTITLTTSNDLLAGDGLGGGAVNVLPGTGSDVTFNILMDYNGGIQTLDDSIGIKLDGATLALGADGLKVNPAGGVQFTTDSLSGARLQKRTVPENALVTSVVCETDLTANDFNVSSGTVSLDYANGQKATTSLPGFLSSTDWNTFNGKMAGTLQNDLLAGDGLGGGAVNVLPGTGSDVTFSLLFDYNGGLATIDDSLGIQLDGGTLWLSSNGLKVNPTGGVMFTANLDDSLNNAHTVLNSWGFRKNATTGSVPIEVLRLELIDPSSVDLNAEEGPALNFYVAEAMGTQQLGGQIATVRESIANAVASAAMIFSTAADDAALSEAMRITSANRVGISTTTPSHPLTIGHIGGLAVKGQDAATATDSSWAITIVSGQPVMEFNASDGKQYTQSINTSDQAIFAGASGGYSFDDDVLVSTGGKIKVGSLSWTRAGSDSIDGAVISLGTLPWEAMPDAAVLEGDLDTDDFDVAAHVVSLDYTNGQKATGSVPGFLSSADWTTFNGSYKPSGTDVAVADGGTGTSTGSITGTGALTFTAGGTNQNVTLTPSGTGKTILGGSVGVGVAVPTAQVSIAKTTTATSDVDTTVSVSMTFNPSAASSASNFAFRSDMAINGANETTGNQYAGYFRTRNIQTNTSTAQYGIAAALSNEAAGNITNQYAMTGLISFASGGAGTIGTSSSFYAPTPAFNASATGKISTVYGLRVAGQYNTYNGASTNGGFTTYGAAVTLGTQGGNTSGTNNNYGVYVSGSGGTAGSGGTVNNYALYINGWLNSYFGGPVGLGITPTAIMHLKAGTTDAGTAPLKFTAGTNLTTAEAGAMEWDGTNLYVTQTSGPTRKTLSYSDHTHTTFGNDITQSYANAGGLVKYIIQNTSNTAASNAALRILATGSGTNDAYIMFRNGSANDWSVGINGSESNRFEIALSTNIDDIDPAITMKRADDASLDLMAGIKLNCWSGDSLHFVGIKPPTYSSGVNQMWVNSSWDTLFFRGATGNAKYAKLTDLGKTH